MEFPKTRNYVYRKCVDRVNKRRLEQNKNMIDICPDDKSLVSNFFNCKCTPNNPYLINKRLINTNDDEKGLTYGAVPILGFKDEFEVLWGNKEEFNENLRSIFECIMTDLTSSKNEYLNDIETVLCDYIVYAKYSTLLHIKEEHNISLFKYFGVYDFFVSSYYMEGYRYDALYYLYSKDKFSDLFAKSFYGYASKYTDYKFFDKRLENNFIVPALIPLLRDYMPKSDSLGLRVKKIIEDDISKMIDQINNLHIPNYESSPEFEFRRKIINASSSYIIELEKIAEQYIIPL